MMPNAAPSLSAIVVSYNTRKLTLECLQALSVALEGVPAEVIVVDNASSDGSVEAIRREFPQISVLANDRNLGFGAANNQGMRQGHGRYFLLLNSDAFAEPGAIATLVRYMEENPTVAAAGPRLLNADGSLQVSCFPFPTPFRAWVENLWLPKVLPHTSRWGDYRKWNHDSPRLVDWVVGACLLVRREAYEQVGGFDEQFFMYAEESDWQRRMRDAGWQIGFTPAARVRHLGGASGAAEKPAINRHFFRSLDYYQIKHHGLTGLVTLRAAMAVGSLLRLPLWAGVLALVPRRRPLAAAKLRLLSWLLVRQATCWNLKGLRPA